MGARSKPEEKDKPSSPKQKLTEEDKKDKPSSPKQKLTEEDKEKVTSPLEAPSQEIQSKEEVKDDEPAAGSKEKEAQVEKGPLREKTAEDNVENEGQPEQDPGYTM